MKLSWECLAVANRLERNARHPENYPRANQHEYNRDDGCLQLHTQPAEPYRRRNMPDKPAGSLVCSGTGAVEG